MPKWTTILYGCLTAYGGEVIASHSIGSSLEADGDRLPYTLEAILKFVDRAYPSTHWEPFEALDHGPVRILIEKGRFTMLILVIEGQEDTALREGMREILQRFEDRNEAGLGRGTLDRRLREDGQNSLATASNLIKVF